MPKGFNNSCQLTATTTAVKIHGRISKERNKVLAFGLISVLTRSAKDVPIIRWPITDPTVKIIVFNVAFQKSTSPKISW